MLARLQRILVLALLAIAGVPWVLAASFGLSVWGLSGIVLVTVLYAGAMGFEFAWMWRANRNPAAERRTPTLAAVLSAFFAELTTAPRVFCWQQPFRSTAHPDRPVADRAARGVVLVHGFVCNRGLWNRWLQRYTALNVPFVAVNLEPVFSGIDAYAAPIEQAVDTLWRHTGRAPVVVAHSMGGLAVRAWARAQGPTAWHRVHHVVTLGTPHAGTSLAALAFSRNGRQMRRASPWLAGLAAAEPADLGRQFTCLYSDCDNIVFPATSARLDGSHAMAVTGWAHVHLVDHPAAWAAVESARQAPASATPERSAVDVVQQRAGGLG